MIWVQVNTEAVRAGCVNVERHIQNLKKFGVNPIVSINHFIHDTDEEIAIVKEFCDRRECAAGDRKALG